MSKWERLIVYPLLLIALFYGVGDELVSSASTVLDEIVAKSIRVVNDEGESVVRISGERGIGYVGIYSSKSDGAIALFVNETTSRIDMNKPNKGLMATGIGLTVNEEQSIIELYSPSDKNITVGESKQLMVLPPSLTISAKNEETSIELSNLNENDDENKYIAARISSTSESNNFRIWDKNNIGAANLFCDKSIRGLFIFNKHGDPSTLLAETTQGHGAIFTYDKYGEDYKTYGYYK